MKEKNRKERCPEIVQKLSVTRSKVEWEGREIPLYLEAGIWRARKRSKALTVEMSTGTGSLPHAKRVVLEYLANRRDSVPVKSTDNLRSICDVYLATPKRCSADVAAANVERLGAIVRAAWGKTLDTAQVADLPLLWPAYVAKRQGKEQPDYNTRQKCNAGINSAMRAARSILIDALHPAYAAAGIILPPGAASVVWAAELHQVRPDADDDALIAAWRALPLASPLWWVVGLARFAGLRRDEILNMRGKWATKRGAGVVIDLRDRPEDQYWTKTGKPYSPLVMEPLLAQALLTIQPESQIITQPDADAWIEREPQRWLKPYVGDARLPLHRLRGLYADHVRRETEEAILARQQGIKAASVALGHASTQTTEKSYLSPG